MRWKYSEAPCTCRVPMHTRPLDFSVKPPAIKHEDTSNKYELACMSDHDTECLGCAILNSSPAIGCREFRQER